MPTASGHVRDERLDIVIHELVHVLQFKTVGARYACESLEAQRQFGSEAYNYGGINGLENRRARGEQLKDLNREQQAQVTQDYRRCVLERKPPLDDVEKQRREGIYGPFIEELRRREV